MEEAEFRLTVNGAERSVTCQPDTPLLDVLRHDLGLAGPKFGCGMGLCGACSVLIDGRARTSCDLPVSAVGLLRDRPGPTEQEVREALDGNLCRCGTHDRIVRAVQKAAARTSGGSAVVPRPPTGQVLAR